MNTKKPNIDNYHEGQRLSLEMLQPQKGKYPICRTDDGIIALIQNTGDKRYFAYGSIWDCEVKEVKEKCIIVYPHTQTVSAEQNEAEKEMRLMEAFGKEKTRKPKNYREYQYKNKIEIEKQGV